MSCSGQYFFKQNWKKGYGTINVYPCPEVEVFLNTMGKKGVIKIIPIPATNRTVFFHHDRNKRYGTNNTYTFDTVDITFTDKIGRRGMVQSMCIPVSYWMVFFHKRWEGGVRYNQNVSLSRSERYFFQPRWEKGITIQITCFFYCSGLFSYNDRKKGYGTDNTYHCPTVDYFFKTMGKRDKDPDNMFFLL